MRFSWKNSGHERVKQRIIVMVKESLRLPYSQIGPVLLLGRKLAKYCILYNALFTKSYHTIRKLSHSYIQFLSSTARNAWCHDTPFGEQNGLHFGPQALLSADGTGPVYSWNDRRIQDPFHNHFLDCVYQSVYLYQKPVVI